MGALLALSLGLVPAASAATLTRFPSSNAAVSGTWSNPTNAYADDAAYATVGVARNSSAARDFGSFGFDSIPAGATIVSATLEMEFRVGNNAGVGTVSAQARVSGVNSGTAASTTTQPTTDTIISSSNLGITSRSQLLDGTFTVRVTTSRGNTGANGAVTTYVDFVRVTVVYSVPDTTPPVVTVPADMTVEATSAAGAVATFSASATDDVDGPLTPTCVPASGATFALGTTTVTCSATDAAGNTGSASFDVTVVDTTAPTVTVPADIIEEATGPTGAAVSFTASASDLVSGSITPTCVPASGSTFALGTTTVTCSATDAAGNTGSASFDVTVVDTTPPDVTVPADVTTAATSPAGATVTYGAATATDLVDGSITPSCSPASGSLFAVGTTTVTCTATDTAGNTGSASFTVTVDPYIDQPPTLDLPADITAEATGPAGAVVTYSATADDLEDGPLTPTCAPASGSTFALGTTTVECSVTDSAANTVTDSFTVTIVDTTPPDVTVPSDIIEEATGPTGAKVSYSASADDIVDGTVAVHCSRNSHAMFHLGTTTVTCEATDSAGNTGSASFDVTVVDTTPPDIVLPPDITVPAAGPNGAIVTFDVTATDLVDGDVPPTCTPASGSLFPVGTTTVTCSATDAAGNSTGDAGPVDESGSYSFLVTVTPYDGAVPSTPPTATSDPAGAASTGLLPFVGLSIAGAAGLFALLAAVGWRRRHPVA